MTQQNLGAARVIDPILSTHAQGYMRPGNVGLFLFPTVDVLTYGGQVLQFGKEGFRRYNTKRAPGAATQRVTFGYQGEKYAIVPGALEAVVPDENQNEALQVPGLDMASDAVDMVLDIHALDHELECAALARNAAKYDANHKVALVGQDRWNGNAADPTADIDDGKEAIRASIGVKPNTCILSPSAFKGARNNEKVLERIMYTGRDAVTTAILAHLWEIQNVYVGEAIVADGAADDTSDVWGHDVILAYVAPPSGSNRRSAARPSYGYTYTIKGNPNVRQPYFDNNRQSWIFPVNADRTAVMAGITAGYLIQNAGAAPA